MVYPNGLESVHTGKEQWDAPSLGIRENDVDEIGQKCYK